MSSRVVIVQELLPQYRVPFFELLKSELAADDIELVLVHGRARGDRAERRDESNLAWALRIRHRTLRIGRYEAVWQPVLRLARTADLVVVEQANRMLVNYVLLLLAAVRVGPPVAFWGHGRNMQSRRPRGLAERAKQWLALQPDWWFAYTQGRAEALVRLGYPAERVTVVQNAVDTSVFMGRDKQEQTGRCVYVGGLHPDKLIPFLLEAASRIAESVPDFTLTVVGDGPERPLVEAAARRSGWLDYRGAAFGSAKADILAGATLLLMPGLVGLVAVEAFAAQTPVVTIAGSAHSPEFEYLDADNAVVLPDGTTTAAYAAHVVALLADPEQVHELRAGCRRAAAVITVSAMAARFANGTRAALRTSLRQDDLTPGRAPSRPSA